MKHILSINDFSGKEIFDEILPKCKAKINLVKKRKPLKFSPEKKVIFAFLEPSTRTRGSYVEASRLLGWERDIIYSEEATSMTKKESIANTARMLAIQGADVLVMRTKIEGASKFAAEILEKDFQVSVQNAGDGTNQHPSQTFLDLLTIWEKLGRLDNFKIGFCGDLKYGRTVHSLLNALSHRKNIYLALVSDPATALQEQYKNLFKTVEEGDSLELLNNCDVIYLTRFQKERFEGDLMELKRLEGKFQINKSSIANFKKNVLIMHPLPYVDEISSEIRSDKRLIIDDQAWYGLPVRMALLEESYKNKAKKISFNPIQNSSLEVIKKQNVTEYFKSRENTKNYKYFRPIDRGTVIDHLSPGLASKILDFLNPKLNGGAKHIIKDIPSKTMGKKDVLVLDNIFLSQETIISICSLSEKITINIIGEEKFEKIKIKNPSLIVLGKCPNINCVTNHDKEAKVKFIASKNGPRCFYCEKYFNVSEILA